MLPRDLAYLAARIDGQQGDVGAEGAGVAQEPEALDGQVGQQTDLDGLLDVDVLAERPADEELLDVGDVDPDAAAQHGETGVHGRLGAQQAVDVGLGQDDVATVPGLGRPGDHVLEAVLRLPDAGRVEAAGEASALEQRSGHEQLGQHVDQAAAAQALRGGVVDDAEARSNVPPSIQMSSIAPVVAAHPAGHAGALEGRTGRAGAADQPLPVAEHDLAVGAHVHEQRELVGGVHAARQDPGGHVAADVAADRRHDEDVGLRIGLQAELPGHQRRHRGERRDVGLLAQVLGVEASSRCVITVLPATVTSWMSVGSIALRATSSSISSAMVPTTSCRRRPSPCPRCE